MPTPADDPVESAQSSILAQAEARSAWSDLRAHLEDWFETPDIEGLKICLCALATHYYPQEKPLWVLGLGDSGSGKTEILIETFSQLPLARIIGDLSPKAFLSHYKNGKGDQQQHSMLHRGGSSQIWLAKDFTTFIAMRYNDRNDVAKALREIWDGRYMSDKGANGTKEWKGKITLVAVATPAFERHWSALSALGERFMTLRWIAGNEDGAMRKARRQMGHEEEIREVSQALVARILSGQRQNSVMPTDDVMRRRDVIAKVVARLRVHVEREEFGTRREVTDVPRHEFPTRISMALSQIIRTHMDLFHKLSPSQEEFDLAERLAMDTVPPDKRRILSLLPLSGEVSYKTILERAGIPHMTLRRRLEDLELTGIINRQEHKDWSARMARYTDGFAELLTASGLGLHAGAKLLTIPRRPGYKASFLG